MMTSAAGRAAAATELWCLDAAAALEDQVGIITPIDPRP